MLLNHFLDEVKGLKGEDLLPLLEAFLSATRPRHGYHTCET